MLLLLLLYRLWWSWCGDGEVGKRVHVDQIGSLLGSVSNVNSFLSLYESDELVAVLTDDDGSEVTGRVVPGDPVVVLVVEDGQTGLVVKLLQSLYRDADIVCRVDGTLPLTLPVVWLRLPALPSGAPEGIWVWSICCWYPGVVCSGPEPTIYIDWLKVVPITAFVLKITFSATGVNRTDIIF